jgi:hypothetical protein
MMITNRHISIFIGRIYGFNLGHFNGYFKQFSAVQLGIAAVKAAIERAHLKPEEIQEVQYSPCHLHSLKRVLMWWLANTEYNVS